MYVYLLNLCIFVGIYSLQNNAVAVLQIDCNVYSQIGMKLGIRLLSCLEHELEGYPSPRDLWSPFR